LEKIQGFSTISPKSYSRRKGKTTEKQKERIATEYTDKSFKGSTLTARFSELIRYITNKTGGNHVHLFTDEHKTYDFLIRKHNASGGVEIIHDQTSSRKARTITNPLYMVNYYDMLLRKDCPMYRRKTICFARSSYNSLLRNAVYMLSHNYMKPVKIKSTAKQTDKKHCSTLGLDGKLLSELKEKVFTVRFLLSKVHLPQFFRQVWTKTVSTPLASLLDNSIPKFAFQ
jgi:hypothetical protein